MKTNKESNVMPTLDDVLSEIAAAPAAPDAQSIRVWITRYPKYARAIIDFATTWVEAEAAGSRSNNVAVANVDRVVNRTMSRVQAMIDAAVRPAVMNDLMAEIRAAGHDLKSFQGSVGIDPLILDSLIERMIDRNTLPVSLITKIAETLQRSTEMVREYFRLPPAPRAVYMARNQPAVQQFSEVVRSSSLSPNEKERWLAATPDTEMGS